jgi:hypothetical protein
VKRPRIGIYQRYWGGNMDEGWTRFVLEQFDFPYVTLTDDEIKKGNLRQRFDTIILPSDPEPYITGEGLEEYLRKRSPDRPIPNFPPEYRSGIGSEGVEALREFVVEGGALIALNEACQLAIDRFGLKLRNVLQGVPSEEFYCPGSTLRARADPCHPAAYGMPSDPLVFFWGGPAFEIIPSASNDQYDVVVSYPERDVLRSGWLIGEDRLKGRAGMVVAHRGQGRIVLLGFRPQHRGQTHGTYKLLFNSLLG